MYLLYIGLLYLLYIGLSYSSYVSDVDVERERRRALAFDVMKFLNDVMVMIVLCKDVFGKLLIVGKYLVFVIEGLFFEGLTRWEAYIVEVERVGEFCDVKMCCCVECCD